MSDADEREISHDQEDLEEAREGLENLTRLRDELDGYIELTEQFINEEVTKDEMIAYLDQTEVLDEI
jgi:hypothetical protein